MSARTKFVLFHGAFGTPERQIEGVFHELGTALAYAQEMANELGVTITRFEVEGWRGRDFVGAWDYAARLIENRKGEDLRPPEEEQH